MENLMQKIVSLAKRRGFIYPGSDIYGGLANSWDYGPFGVELKNNIKNLWWKFFVQDKEDMFGIDAALIMNRKVWQASGHEKEFVDPLVDCKKCKNRFRMDKINDSKKCPKCGGELTKPRMFNAMMKTFLGPVEDDAGLSYLRPETAQSMFVNFKNIIDSLRPKIPFGIAQTGKVFRNEITPGNFIFRMREFEQMEIEYFIREKEWKKWFDYWLEEMKKWMEMVGISKGKLYFHEIPDGERAHYSKRTIDIEYKFPFGMDELYGLAYRGDFDLKNHQKSSGVNLEYRDPKTNEKFLPHVIEPTFGVDRTLLAILCSAYTEEKERIVLKLKPSVAPVKVAVFPLLANKPELVEKAREVYGMLKIEMSTLWDGIGNIGKRYRRQDEIGTLFCITIDFDSLKKNDVTVRYRDTMKQERVKINKLLNYLSDKFI
ncbi:MAG TPA: glycine--tRNA ligase [bacterium]|nr:glycine--tRNA ligase [bacterium]